uniref:Uncharacterized protein n=1 Tax=Timema tahoe TaxID=61484 RepID=A0A7R9FMG2_9NEOP|nr:unnamed protein product [Timema tahoe]
MIESEEDFIGEVCSSGIGQFPYCSEDEKFMNRQYNQEGLEESDEDWENETYESGLNKLKMGNAGYGFARIVAHHPYVILVAVTVFSTTCLVIPLTTKKLPNFSDPQLGFEARGTVIAQRLTAWNNLLEATRPSGNLLVNPIEQHTPVASNEIFNHIKPFPISKVCGLASHYFTNGKFEAH